MKVKKIAFLGLFTSAALILSFLETLIPNIVPIPGFKLGLANFAVLLALYIFGFKEAIIVYLFREFFYFVIFFVGFDFFHISICVFILSIYIFI